MLSTHKVYKFIRFRSYILSRYIERPTFFYKNEEDNIAWKLYICVLVLLHANRSGRKFYKSVSEPLKK